jgi:hypothetical protein
MFCPKSFSSLFSSPHLVLIRIARVNCKIPIIDFLGVGLRRLDEEESKENQTKHIYIFGQPHRRMFASEATVGRNPFWPLRTTWGVNTVMRDPKAEKQKIDNEVIGSFPPRRLCLTTRMILS